MFQILGLLYITSSEAGILQATIPIFTVILASLILKEHANNLKKLSILISVFGVIFIFSMTGINVESYSWTGVIFILISTLSMAFYTVFARNLTSKYPLFTLTYYITFVGFVAFNVTAICYHLYNQTLDQFFKPLLHIEFVGPVLYLGIFASFITSFLSNFALKRIEAANMSVFNNVSILITILAGVIFLNESIYYYHIIGAILIIAGVFGTNYTGRRKKATG